MGDKSTSVTAAAGGAALAHKLVETAAPKLRHLRSVPETVSVPKGIPEGTNSNLLKFPVQKLTPTLWQRAGSLLGRGLPYLGRAAGVVAEYAGPWVIAAAVWEIALGPGDVPARRASATDNPFSEETAPESVDVEKLRRDYLAEIDRLRRTLANGDISEGEAGFLRAQLGLLTMLVGALPVESTGTPAVNARTPIVASGDATASAALDISQKEDRLQLINSADPKNLVGKKILIDGEPWQVTTYVGAGDQGRVYKIENAHGDVAVLKAFSPNFLRFNPTSLPLVDAIQAVPFGPVLERRVVSHDPDVMMTHMVNGWTLFGSKRIGDPQSERSTTETADAPLGHIRELFRFVSQLLTNNLAMDISVSDPVVGEDGRLVLLDSDLVWRIDAGAPITIRDTIEVLRALVSASAQELSHTHPSLANSLRERGATLLAEVAEAAGSSNWSEELWDDYLRRIETLLESVHLSSISAEEQDLRLRLKSPDLGDQWVAWKELYRLNPEAARKITSEDLGPLPSAVPGTYGLRAFISHAVLPANPTPQDVALWRATYARAVEASGKIKRWRDMHYDRSAWVRTTIDLATVHPSESLVDFAPVQYRKFASTPAMSRYLYKLSLLMREHGESDPRAVLDAFVKTSWKGNARQKPIRVIEFPSGYRIFTNGHHRSAALVQAARKNIIPKSWPREVPVEMLKVGPDFPIPEAVFLQIFAPAHKLTLDELLPPHDRAHAR